MPKESAVSDYVDERARHIVHPAARAAAITKAHSLRAEKK